MASASADACSSSSTPSTASSSSSFEKASRRLTRNGMSLKRISVSSLTEARAATKSALRAGKYRVKETSRDLWTRTKAPLAHGKRKSKELVDLSADLISNLSIRVQKKLHSRHLKQHSFNPHVDASESDHEYFWESDFSDASFSDSSGDEEAEAIINSASDRGRSRHDYYDRKENEESDCQVVADEVAGDCIRSEQAVECKSIRKIEDADQYRATVSHVPSIEQIKQQLMKIQQNSNKRRQQVPKGSPANQTADQVQPSRCLTINPNTVNREQELSHATSPSVSEPPPKRSPSAPALAIDHRSKSNRKLATRAQRPREQPPPPPSSPPPPPLPRTLPPSLLSSTSSLNSAPLSLTSTSSCPASSSPSCWHEEKEDTSGSGQTANRHDNDVNGIIKNTQSSDGNNQHNRYEREFNCLKLNGGLQTVPDISAVEEGDEERDDDTDTESSYEVPVDSCPWFRPDLTRSEAEKYLLSLDSLSDGCFVIRPGGSVLYPFSLSLVHGGRIYHLNIRADAGSSYSLGKGTSGRVFPSLKYLVLYYANKPLMLVSSKCKPAPNQNNNHHDLPAEPRKYVRLSLIS